MRIGVLSIVTGVAMLLFFNNLIAEKILIVRGDGSYPPQEIYKKKKLSGFHVDIIEEVCKSEGIEYEYKRYPWKRSVSMIEKGEADAITFISKNAEREKFAIFLEENILSVVENGFFIATKNKGKIKYDGNLENLKPYTISALSSYSYSESFDNAKFLKIDRGAKKEVQILNKVLIDRSQVGIGNSSTLKHIIKTDGMGDKITFLSPPVSTKNVFIAFSKEKGKLALAKKFAEGMKKLKSSKKYNEIMKKYGL